ncbi:expressed unknown protein [Seminavis robusta]|uniref:Uncharacterized protein n=1 Tax=Seminavis robusta TaxID=568900 RepID=A0A9N8HVE5_9STRA|nr:expressed unknown protein [Seminavis robusta]|eukprot:Sro1792_g297870.1 n/a (222) ;mRNA; r:12797-13462
MRRSFRSNLGCCLTYICDNCVACLSVSVFVFVMAIVIVAAILWALEFIRSLMGHDNKLFPGLYPSPECHKCQRDGDCSLAYQGGPGKYCGIPAGNDNYNDGSYCCCPVESKCQMTSWECLCEGSKAEVQHHEIMGWVILILVCVILLFHPLITDWCKRWIDWCCPDRYQLHEWDDDIERESLIRETYDANNTTYQATSYPGYDFSGTGTKNTTNSSGYDFT